jgi:hypothetical protein
LVVTTSPHLAAHQFGFTDVRAYQQAVDLARALSVRDPDDTAASRGD